MPARELWFIFAALAGTSYFAALAYYYSVAYVLPATVCFVYMGMGASLSLAKRRQSLPKIDESREPHELHGNEK